MFIHTILRQNRYQGQKFKRYNSMREVKMKNTDNETRKHIRIQDLLPKSREKERHKSHKREPGNSIEYGTDSKFNSRSQSYLGELEEMRAVIQSCNSCMEKFSQFTTKKPSKTHTTSREEKSVQTLNKPFLINLIEERVSELCRQNRKLSKLVMEKQSEIMERQGEISQIEEKFTNILYSLGQDLAYLKTVGRDSEQMRVNVPSNPETPSYLKALLMEGRQ